MLQKQLTACMQISLQTLQATAVKCPVSLPQVNVP